ncbi:MAG: hypothetical protein NZ602_10400 [Thermoguttaceae bacterium]|nr:hypothetical protein [Thermoguttaceae bacterium]
MWRQKTSGSVGWVWFSRCVWAVGLGMLTSAALPKGYGQPADMPCKEVSAANQQQAPPVEWNMAEVVFLGQIKQVESGPSGQSAIPVASVTLKVQVLEVFRGDLRVHEEVECRHAFRQWPNKPQPEYSLEKPSLIAAERNSVDGRLTILRIELANPDTIAEARAVCALPFGWRIENGQMISPWAELGPKAWQGDALGAKIVCAKSGRPALLAGPKIRLEVEPLPPAKKLEGFNPDGDGQFRITVSNPTKESVTVPALLAKGDKILWGNSLVVLCQGKAFVCPDFQPEVGPVQPVVLPPGESVSGVINVLKIPGIQWPKGADSVVFQFCLGEKSIRRSFYYHSRHHDPIRQNLSKGETESRY